MKQLIIGASMIGIVAIITALGSARADEVSNAQMREKPRAIGIYRPIDFSTFGSYEFNSCIWENHVRELKGE